MTIFIIALILGTLRIFGLKHIAFQAIAHCFTAMLFTASYFKMEVNKPNIDSQPVPFFRWLTYNPYALGFEDGLSYFIIAFLLSILETFCAFLI